MANARRRHATSDSSLKWASLTWDDLDAWAGGRSVARGRSYQGQGRVRDLAISEEGRLLATVTGRNQYVVSVWLKEDKDNPIESKCTCPVGYDGCKHAVAVVAEYLDQLSREKEVPIAQDDDPRWDELDAENRDEEYDEDEIGAEAEDAPLARTKPGRRTRDDWDEKIKGHIFAKSREQLAELVWSLTERFDELRDEFRERIALGEGDVDRLIAQARKELNRVTSQEAWQNSWTGEGNLPDYSKLLHRLERLVELGHSDAVARLGREIIERGIEQVGQAHDEGETGMELAGCMPVVFKAVAQSSLTPAQKLLFAIDAQLQDEYDVIGDAADIVLGRRYQPSDWSAVADELARRLSATGSKRRRPEDDDDDDASDDFSRNYQRDQISNWLSEAMSNAGRSDEVLAMYEHEARATGSYERLVKHLIEQKRFDDAQRWATEGIAKTASKLSGIATNLANQLCEIARSRKQWDVVAAHAAYEFFDRPSRESFNRLLAAADKAGCQESVRQIALHFLETGVSPIRVSAAKRGEAKIQISADWPLPMPDYLVPLLQTEYQVRRMPQPHLDVLIDMAIADKRPDEVLHWYDKMCASRKQSPYGDAWNGAGAHADRVAEAVAKSHPQRSLEIYRHRVEQNLTQASVGAYETVASYLRRMRPIMKSIDREPDWKQLIEEIQIRYRNRPKFMEILDRLEGKPILAGRKARR